MTSPTIFIAGLAWHQVVMRKSGTSLQLFYDNGVIASGTGSSIPSSTEPLLLGRRNGSQEFPFFGEMDEIAIWKRTLSNGEISQLFNGGNRMQLMIVPEPSTLALTALGLLTLSFYSRRPVFRGVRLTGRRSVSLSASKPATHGRFKTSQ